MKMKNDEIANEAGGETLELSLPNDREWIVVSKSRRGLTKIYFDDLSDCPQHRANRMRGLAYHLLAAAEEHEFEREAYDPKVEQ